MANAASVSSNSNTLAANLMESGVEIEVLLLKFGKGVYTCAHFGVKGASGNKACTYLRWIEVFYL